jgi:hypothetical protein
MHLFNLPQKYLLMDRVIIKNNINIKNGKNHRDTVDDAEMAIQRKVI